MSTQKIIVAPNAFKGALSAEEAAKAITRGLVGVGARQVVEIPIADGGDGSLPVLVKYLKAEIRTTGVRNPFGQTINASWGYQPDSQLGIIELAEASGIRLLKKDELNPMGASSFGTGQQLFQALEAGAKGIYLSVGGSATVDLGVGIMEALGAQFFSGTKEVMNVTPAKFMDIDRVDLHKLDRLKGQAKFSILCDVNNPLLGKQGAAHIFGPQKGADADRVDQLEKGISHMAKLLEKETGSSITEIPGGGAAGGVAAGLVAALGAEIVNGGEQILELAQFEQHLRDAALVITGEGKIDEQTNYGKGPGFVAQLAHQYGVRVVGLSGSLDTDTSRIKFFDELIAISDKADPLELAMRKTAANLEKAASHLSITP